MRLREKPAWKSLKGWTALQPDYAILELRREDPPVARLVLQLHLTQCCLARHRWTTWARHQDHG